MSEVAEKPKHLGLHARIENKMLPEISDELLAEMAAHITPLMKSGTENPNYFTISNLPEELRNVSFLWGPSLARRWEGSTSWTALIS
jgi:hypothetical protein